MVHAGNGNGNGNGHGHPATTHWPGAEVALPSFAACQPSFDREMARARRYERPLGIIVQDFDPVWAFAPDLARELVRSLRTTDLAALDAAGKQVVVVLPETNRAQAEIVAARLQRLIETPAVLHLRAGTAAFPADALILDDLVAAAARARTATADVADVATAADAAEPRAEREGVREGAA